MRFVCAAEDGLCVCYRHPDHDGPCECTCGMRWKDGRRVEPAHPELYTQHKFTDSGRIRTR